MGSRVKNLVGKRFGRLLVVSFAGLNVQQSATWLCDCDCGNKKVVSTPCIRQGVVSCGCFRKDVTTTHGMTDSKEHLAWLRAKDRCRQTSSKSKHYHDRGISMCAEWFNSFEAFYRDMGQCPTGHTLDREDNNVGYQPGNCRWVTHKVQCNNRSSNRLVTHKGVTQNITQWAESTGIMAGTIAYRLNTGWPPHLALDPSISVGQARRISKKLLACK